MHRFILSLGLVISLIITGCAKISPSQVEEHLSVYYPNNERDKKYPVVFFFQGSNGKNTRAVNWSIWFSQHGIASVIMDNAGILNRENLSGQNYSNHLAPALEALKSNTALDLSHYAVMGFSRGATAALKSASSLDDNQPKPDFVFALYPGDKGECPNSHEEQTSVHIFYGELDDWGSYQGNRKACERMASYNDNATFHLIKGAHHGYDGSETSSWECCGGRKFRKIPNADGLEATKVIILETVREKWNIK